MKIAESPEKEKFLSKICSSQCTLQEKINEIITKTEETMLKELKKLNLLNPKNEEDTKKRNEVEERFCRSIVQNKEVYTCTNCYYTIIDEDEENPHCPNDNELFFHYFKEDSPDGGMSKYRKKWWDIKDEIDSGLNKFGTGEEYGSEKAERPWWRCLHYIRSGGLAHFWKETKKDYDPD